MRSVHKAEELARWCERYRAAGLSVGLVPTMGALHAGHVSLVTRSVSECDRTVVTVFVNPTQFGPGEDLAAYPRQAQDDARKCEEAGADLVLFGETSELYPPGAQTWVHVEELTRPLCGVSRPHHFRGVTTIVSKLFFLAGAHRAYFGQKDYQQALVIGRLVRDLQIPTQVCVCPIVRDPDGLAMSSRNAYLEPAQRRAALRINRALSRARELIVAGERSVERLRAELLASLDARDDLQLDYAELRGAVELELLAGTLDDARLEASGGGVVIAVAAEVGSTRLIDNVLVGGA